MDNKLRIKTVSVVAGTETLVEMPHSHAYIRNIGEEKVYASTSPDITPYDDGVIEIKPNRTKVLANIFDVKKGVGEIYLLSVGDTVCEIESTNVLNFSETVEGGDGSSSGSGENGKDGRGILKITFLSSTGGDVAGIEGAVDTYQITYTDGTKSTYDVTNGSKGIDGKQGVSIVNVSINDGEHLIIEFSDGNTQDIGKLPQSDVDLTNYYTINETNDKINTEIQSSLENYVQKDGDKVLSTNDYTTVEKTKLANLTNYDDTEIKNNIIAVQTTVDTKVDKVVGYSLVSDNEIEKLSAITNPIKVKGKVDSFENLPTGAVIGDLYFVGTEDSEDYKEYVLTESREWEQIGVSKVDLSAYVLKEDGKSLVSDTEITRLAEVKNYDDTQIKNDIALNLSSIGMSRKNLLPYRFVSGNAGGVTVTVDNDGTLNLSGTTKTSLTYNLNFPVPLVFDRDVLIIGATSLTNIHYNCKVDTRVNGSLYPTIGTKGLLIPAGTKIEYLYVQQTTTGTTVSATIQPMICYADIIDKSYEPYTPDLQTQINKNDNDIALNTSSIGISRKNLLKVTGATQELNGVTFTVNDDGSITVSGKNTSDTTTFYRITNAVKLPIGGSYTLNGCPANNKNNDGTTKVYWRVEKQGSVIAMDTGNGKTFTVTESANPTMAQICVYAGADFTDNPVTFYPMIRYSDVTDDTYEQYQDDIQTQINNIIARLTALEG